MRTLIQAAGCLESPVACLGTQGSGTAAQAFVDRRALLRPSKRNSSYLLPQPLEGRPGPRVCQSNVVLGAEPGRGGTNRAHWQRHGAGTGDSGAERRAAGEEQLRLLASAAAMATVDLEKLRMSGAGKAIGVLTSGGDAQGDGARWRVYGWIWGFCLSSGPFGFILCPSLGTSVCVAS